MVEIRDHEGLGVDACGTDEPLEGPVLLGEQDNHVVRAVAHIAHARMRQDEVEAAVAVDVGGGDVRRPLTARVVTRAVDFFCA